MIYIDEVVTVDHSDEICAVQFRCSNAHLLRLINYFIGRSSLNDLLRNFDANYLCRYFRSVENDVELKYLYTKNYKSDCPVSFNYNLVEDSSLDLICVGCLSRVAQLSITYRKWCGNEYYWCSRAYWRC